MHLPGGPKPPAGTHKTARAAPRYENHRPLPLIPPPPPDGERETPHARRREIRVLHAELPARPSARRDEIARHTSSVTSGEMSQIVAPGSRLRRPLTEIPHERAPEGRASTLNVGHR